MISDWLWVGGEGPLLTGWGAGRVLGQEEDGLGDNQGLSDSHPKPLGLCQWLPWPAGPRKGI